MDVIELERWKPSEADPRRLEYAGQPVAQEVFEELKHRLGGMGYLPDEYFLMDSHWENGREIPRGADIFCTSSAQAPYPSPRRRRQGSFIPLCLLSPPQSLCWIAVGPPSKPSAAGSMGKGGARERTQFSSQTETEWSGLCDDAAAGRPGAVGRKMAELLMQNRCNIDYAAYCNACKKAIDINDPEKVLFMTAQAQSCVEDLEPSFYGEMASYAHLDHCAISRQIIEQCNEKQIAAAPPRLLVQFARDFNLKTLSALVEKGISGGPYAADALHILTYGGRNSWIAKRLLEKRMWVDTNDYGALHACVQNDAVEVCKLLLDGGVDFDGYQQWAQTRPCAGHEKTLQALAEHWSELQAEVEQTGALTEAQQSGFDGGLTLG